MPDLLGVPRDDSDRVDAIGLLRGQAAWTSCGAVRCGGRDVALPHRHDARRSATHPYGGCTLTTCRDGYQKAHAPW